MRAYDTHFAIARNHENPEREGLIEEHERFAVVETVSGEAVKLARRTGRGSSIGGNTGPGYEDPPSRHRVAGGGESSTRFARAAEGIELLNEHWHESPGARSSHTCPACDMAVFATDDAVHHGGELYHQDCARRRPDAA